MSLLNAAVPSFSQDVVAIYPGIKSIPIPGVSPSIASIPGFIPIQVFEKARPMSCQVRRYSEFMGHPLENGAEVTDHRIIRPDELTISFIIRPEDYKITYQLIKLAYINAIRFTVQTKADIFTDMFIQEIPHEEDPALFNTITMVILFREVQFFSSQVQAIDAAKATNPLDASTAAKGSQVAGAASGAQSGGASILYKAAKGVL